VKGEREGRESDADSPNLHVVRVKLDDQVLLDSPGESARVGVGKEVSEGEDEIGLLDELLNGRE